MKIEHIYKLAALSLLLLAGSCKQEEKQEIGKVEVEAMRIVPTTDLKTTPYVGRVVSAQSTEISSPNPGTLSRITVRKGQHVKAGDLLAEISSETINSAWEIADATLKQARDGHERMLQVYADGGVTELKKVEVESQLRKAEAAMKAAEEAKEKCRIRSPFDAVVEDIFVEEGIELIPARPVLRLSNINAVELHIPVPETEISGLKIGQSSEFNVPALDLEASASIIYKGVTASAISHTYDCILVPDIRHEGLLPGMVCKVFMKTEEEGQLIIPLDCVMTGKLGRYVWTVSPEGKVTKTMIKVNDFAAEGVIVSEGLKAGDLVVTEGRRKISGGMEVKVKMRETR